MGAEDTLVQLAVNVIAGAFLFGAVGAGLLVGALLSAALGAASREMGHRVPFGVMSHQAWLSHRLRLRYGIPAGQRQDRAAGALPFERAEEDERLATLPQQLPGAAPRAPVPLVAGTDARPGRAPVRRRSRVPAVRPAARRVRARMAQRGQRKKTSVARR
jgi:hypothetical protein